MNIILSQIFQSPPCVDQFGGALLYTWTNLLIKGNDTTVVDNQVPVLMQFGNCLNLQRVGREGVQMEYMFLVVEPLLLDVSSCDW